MKYCKTLSLIAAMLSIIIGLSTCSEPEKPKPEITQLIPLEGTVGTPVTVVGKNFASATKVNFGIVESSIAAKTDTEIVTVVPAGLTPGIVTVTVISDGGTSQGVNFQVLASQPEIVSIEPEKGSSGMEITLKGKYLSTASSVTFGSISVSDVLSKTETEVNVNVPDGLEPGAIDVTITSEGGTSEAATFTVVGKPAISSITPAIGPAGKKVTIAGIYFEETSQVFFGNGEADFTIINATQLEAVVPATASTGKVKVVTPGGIALSNVDFIVKDGPMITTFTPASGIVNAVVTINGTNFDAGGIEVKFGTGKATTVTVVNATQLTAKVPATAVTGKITVTTLAGSAVSATNFTVIGSPAVTGFAPASGNIGAEVTITGSNFVNVSAIKFNATTVAAGSYTIVSPTQIKAKVPSSATTGKISVTSTAGTGSSTSNFTVVVPPAITSFSPANGAQGSSVVIAGTNFSNITAVRFNGIDVGNANFTVNSATQITAKVPATATWGKITVVNALGTATSASDFYVTPFITSINPISGPTGTTVTVTGTNLNSAKVKFNTTQVSPLTNTATSITVNVPSGVTGALNVTVVNSGGTSNAKTFTVAAGPEIEEIIAVQNITEQLLLIKGKNLTGATKVLFGSTEASIATSTSKVVTTFIPASLSLGSYSVKVVTAKGTSNGKSFELVATQPPATGGVSLVNGASASSLPAGYVPPVSNAWDNLFVISEPERFLISESQGGTLTVTLQKGDSFVDGTGSFDKTVVDGVVNNYVEFTISGIRYVGVWTPPSGYDAGLGKYCYHHMTLISSESGKQLTLEVKDFECE